jgi:hypothetical protein
MSKILHEENILEIKNFLEPDYCQDLIEYLDKNNEESGDNWKPVCFPGVLGGNVGEPQPTDKISVEDMGKIRDKMHASLEEFLGKKVKNVTMSAHKFPEGSYALPHSDSADIDGSYGAWQMNKYACILYLNSGYEGGQVYFPQHDIEVAPEAGSALLFEGSPQYLHGVKEITSGERFTILTFWDDFDAVYEKDFLDQKVDQQKEALEYVENMHDYGDHSGKSFGRQNPEDLYGILSD